MRTCVRLGLLSAVSTFALLASGLAWADDGGTEGGLLDGGTPQQNCDPTTLWCSNGEAQQKIESKPGEELPVGIDTGWMPACPDKMQHNCGKSLQVRAWIRFTPLESGQPIYSINMPAAATKMDARWPTTDGLDLGLAKGTTGAGSFKVAHGMVASFALWFDTSVFTGEVSIDADTLIPLIPGGQKFNYAAVASTKFTPWGFDKVDLSVGGTDLQNSQLFAISFAELGKIVNVNNMDDYVEGSFSFNAVTHSTFSYQTTSVVPLGATGPIASMSGTTLLPGPFENAADFMAMSKGVLRYVGDIELLPVIHITKIAGFGITLDFPISVGIKFPYDSSAINVQGANANVHIPLPNVEVPTMAVNFGDVAVGEKKTMNVEVENTGELGGMIVQVTSDSTAFTAPSSYPQLDPEGGTYNIPITFKPTKTGKYTANVTVKTNDPDTPEATFKVTGGIGEEIPPDQPDAGTGSDAGYTPTGPGFYSPDSEGGCGCRTSANPDGLAVTAFSMLGLGLALLRRQRRRG